MERIWLSSYPAGVPADVALGEFPSLGAMFASSVERHRDRVAFINMGAKLSYGEVDTLSLRFAAYLQSVLELPRGARVAIMMPNVLQYPVAMLGALRAGYVVVNCNPLYTPRELEHQLKDSGAVAIVILENFARTLERAIAATGIRHVVMARMGDLLGFPKGAIVNFVVKYVRRLVPRWRLAPVTRFTTALAQGAAAGFRPVAVGPDDTAFLQYTGGTTGVAKGAVLSHGNMLANLTQAHAWIRPVLREGDELVVTVLPLYHIFALTANCFTFIKIGASNLLITNPRDVPAMVAELAKYRFTILIGVNTLFNALMNDRGFARLDFSALKVALGGGMSVQKAVAERWQKLTGKPLIEAYGLTETSPAVTINPLDLAEFNGMIGLPLPSTEVVIRDDDGRDLPLGTPGELCVRGPQVMKAYYRRPDETAKVFMADGFMRTGDIAVMNERGFIHLVDRKKDTIIVSGFNVYPNEVEDIVALHPGVREVAAVGVPDAHSGETVKIFVVRKDPALTGKSLIEHCRRNLTRYKVPRQVEFRDDLPKSTVGKILRRALRDETPAS